MNNREKNTRNLPFMITQPSTYRYYDDDWIVNEASTGQDVDEVESDESLDEFADIFKIPKVPKGRKGRSKSASSALPSLFEDKKPKLNGNAISNGTSTRGRKRFVPLSLKTCSLCSQEFPDHSGNLAHWKNAHPDAEVVYKCLEVDRGTQLPCNFTSKESEDIFKHRSKHKVRDSANLPDIKPEVEIE